MVNGNFLVALNDTVKRFGTDIISNRRLLNILDDVHAFRDVPAYRKILESAYKENILANVPRKNNPEDIQVFINKSTDLLVRNYAYDKTIARELITSICNVANGISQETEDAKSPVSNEPESPSADRTNTEPLNNHVPPRKQNPKPGNSKPNNSKPNNPQPSRPKFRPTPPRPTQHAPSPGVKKPGNAKATEFGFLALSILGLVVSVIVLANLNRSDVSSGALYIVLLFVQAFSSVNTLKKVHSDTYRGIAMSVNMFYVIIDLIVPFTSFNGITSVFGLYVGYDHDFTGHGLLYTTITTVAGLFILLLFIMGVNVERHRSNEQESTSFVVSTTVIVISAIFLFKLPASLLSDKLWKANEGVDSYVAQSEQLENKRKGMSPELSFLNVGIGCDADSLSRVANELFSNNPNVNLYVRAAILKDSPLLTDYSSTYDSDIDLSKKYNGHTADIVACVHKKQVSIIAVYINDSTASEPSQDETLSAFKSRYGAPELVFDDNYYEQILSLPQQDQIRFCSTDEILNTFVKEYKWTFRNGTIILQRSRQNLGYGNVNNVFIISSSIFKKKSKPEVASAK